MKKIGVLTIGQAPRTDIEEVLFAHLTREMVIQRGALDGWTKQEIEEKFSPAPEEELVLTTKLNTGESVILAEEKIVPLLQEKVIALEKDGCSTILLLCTGEFPTLRSRRALLLQPDRVLARVIDAILPSGKLGVLCPLPEQQQMIREKWSSYKGDLLLESVSPYTGRPEEFEQAAARFRENGADIIVLDCMGYQPSQRKIVQTGSGAPVLLSVSLLARIAGEVIAD
ncbi:AroM family protein [Risungbinella massiliensis]|uniref:AroM family protein n=1 Tax=Risungbinella massiliensis TaxID=1329796 RepID=UPI0005CBBB28|nr:AroM family protein [Risungbinella massiliensis]